jgi:hypothetical protein
LAELDARLAPQIRAKTRAKRAEHAATEIADTALAPKDDDTPDIKDLKLLVVGLLPIEVHNASQTPCLHQVFKAINSFRATVDGEIVDEIIDEWSIRGEFTDNAWAQFNKQRRANMMKWDDNPGFLCNLIQECNPEYYEETLKPALAVIAKQRVVEEMQTTTCCLMDDYDFNTFATTKRQCVSEAIIGLKRCIVFNRKRAVFMVKHDHEFVEVDEPQMKIRCRSIVAYVKRCQKSEEEFAKFQEKCRKDDQPVPTENKPIFMNVMLAEFLFAKTSTIINEHLAVSDCQMFAENDSTYELFQGYGWNEVAEPEAEANTKLFISHIQHIICNNDADYYNYFMEWLRILYCEPKFLHSTCPVFYSMEGAGKGALQKGLMKLFGKYSFLTAYLSDVVGNDNHQIAGMKLIMPNEIADSSKDVQLSEDGIKPIIDPILNVRGKWVKPYVIKNYAGAIFATNHKQSLPVSANQRRFAFIECSNEYCAIKKNPGTRAYFDALFAEIESDKFGNALHTYLTNMKPTGADVRRLPETPLLAALRKASASVIELFVADYARQLRIGMSGAHPSYRTWCMENGYKPLCNKNWSLQMNDYCELRHTRCGNRWHLRTECYERFPVAEGEDDPAERLTNDDCGI